MNILLNIVVIIINTCYHVRPDETKERTHQLPGHASGRKWSWQEFPHHAIY